MQMEYQNYFLKMNHYIPIYNSNHYNQNFKKGIKTYADKNNSMLTDQQIQLQQR